MIYEESEEEICSKTTNITTDMCEYDKEDTDNDTGNNAETANRNKEIQEQDIETILEESPKQVTKAKLLKRIDNKNPSSNMCEDDDGGGDSNKNEDDDEDEKDTENLNKKISSTKYWNDLWRITQAGQQSKTLETYQ